MTREIVSTDIPYRLDRLAWSRWHWLVVISLGITWVLDGLEVTVVGALGGLLEDEAGLGMSAAQVGLAASVYIAGAVCGALFFGHLTDRLGRKRLFLVTLAIYVVSTLATACSWGFGSFAVFRFFTGAAIGGEYAAINSAIDELLPARVRGFTDLAINGTYWIGTAIGAASSTLLLDPALFPRWLGWRIAFGLGAVLAFSIVLVRRFVPESPRWLVLRGRVEEAEAIVRQVEAQSFVHPEAEAMGAPLRITVGRSVGFVEVARTLLRRHPQRTVLCLALMIAQAFFYNSIFFSYSLILTRFFSVAPEGVGRYLLPFAVGNFLGPLILGRAFDTRGRKPMIVATYAISGVMLLLSGLLFLAGLLDATTQTLLWSVTFFFGSAAASAAYLTASELFPIEIRAMAIALFYAVGTGVGGLVAPALFGVLVGSGDPSRLFAGYALGAVLMVGAALVAAKLGVAAERRSLEALARPLSSESE